MNRGVEIDSDVADGPHSVILPQVTNGVAVRMAVLYLLAGGAPDWRDAAERRRASDEADPDPRRPGDRSVARHRRGRRRARRRTARSPAVGRDLGAPDGARGARRRGQGRRARADRPARAPARAGPGGPRDGRDRRDGGRGGRLHRRLRDAQHRSGHRQSGGGRVHREPGAARRARRGSIRSARSRWARRGSSSPSSARWSGPARSR